MDFETLTRFLRDVCSTIQELVRVPSDLVLHRTKCCSLAKSYVFGLQVAMERVEELLSLSSRADACQNLIPSLAELYHAMVQGKRFIGDCLQRDEWVKRTLVLALSRDAVDVCLPDLIWCICLIDQAVEQVLTSSRGGFPEHHDESLETVLEKKHDMYTRLSTLWADVSEEEDLDILLGALNQKVAEYESSIRSIEVSEYRLAKFMRQKLSSGNFELTRADEALPESLWVDADEVKFIDSIGKGAFALVFKVEWWGNILGQKEFFGVDEASFGREAAIQARLRHPNLVQLICCTAKPLQEKCSLVMELMDMDLHSLINKQIKDGRETPFSLVTSVDIMLQVAKGMEYLHRLGIMHRDLKSVNVLVSKPTPLDFLGNCSGDYRVSAKVADFGVSKAKYRRALFTTPQAGTTRWRAPEVFEMGSEDDFQNAKYTMKADVYSFAMVCYEILTGKIPFDDGGYLTGLYQRLLRGERPQLPSSCPPYLANYIKRCWHGDPSKRPSFVQISRTLRHLKGVLLTRSADPLSSVALSSQSGSLIEDKVSEIIGPDWVYLSRGFISRSMAILFEMPLYKMMTERYTKKKDVPLLSKGTNSNEKATSSFPSHLVVPEMPSRRWFPRWMRSWLTKKPPRRKSDLLVDDSWLEDLKQGGQGVGNALRSFTLEEISAATNEFREPIGIGAFSSVFHGTLADGQSVAVKVLRNNSSVGPLAEDVFAAEVKVLGRVRHPNIVSLFGWCTENGCFMIVYEHMTRGDLSVNLFEQKHPNLSWRQRYKIVSGLASALKYLHYDECKPQVLHRLINAYGVLLDEDCNARLGAFGQAVLMEHEEGTTDDITGPSGFIAPEYFHGWNFTPAADVYSFGAVALILASGKNCVDPDVNQIMPLPSIVRKLYEAERLLDAGDENLELAGDLDVKQLKCVLQVGLACTDQDPNERPNMGFVDLVLKGVLPPPIPRRPIIY